jgi:1-acyl-sn-glycerol-3-phosphate acyltransferase
MRTWTRRTISLGILFPAALANILLAPLIVVVLVLLDIVKDQRLPLTRAYLLITFYLVWAVLGVLAAFGVWGFFGSRDRQRFLEWNYALQRVWTHCFAKVGIALFSLRLNVEGDYSFGRNPFILLVRHTSLADTILVSWFVLVWHRMRMRYVMKKELLWETCLDIVGNRLSNYFVDRNTPNSSMEVGGIVSLAGDLGPCEGIVMYPEGTRFSERKRAQALHRLKEQGDRELLRHAEMLRYVLPPRLAGTLALLEKAPHADVVFFAHGGFEGASSFADIFRGSMIGCNIHARYWGVPACSVPRGIEAQKRWLYQQWHQIDELVATWCVPATR